MNQINYTDEIQKLKQEKNALILAHYYVDGAIQDIADYIGDSYYLSQIALNSNKDTIVFCGVHFMAESAKMLSPDKTIIIPDEKADCPMAHMVSTYEIEHVRAQYDDLAVVCYINSTAEIKALSDVCVTSANALTIIKGLKEKNIFFVPDKNLASYVASKIPEKNFIFNSGFCCVHNDITKDELVKCKEDHPNVKVLSHPECDKSVLALSDFIGSTSAIIDYVAASNDEKFIICTEVGILHQLIRNNPGKQFYIANDYQICRNMKKITVEKLYNSLVTLTPQMHVDEKTSVNARKALKNMHLLAQ